MKNIKLILIFALSMLLAACERDNVDQLSATDKINISFVTAAKSNVDITTRVSESAESDINSVYVFVFQDGKCKVNDYVGNLTLTNSGQYTRTYTGELDSKNFVSGAVKVYAVANPVTEMWNKLDDLKTAAANGESAFLSALYTVDQSFTEPLGTSITLIGMAGTNGSANIDASGNLGTRIILKRPYASVAFNFINGAPAASDTNRAGNTVSFTPTSYDVYNIPQHSALFEGANVTGLTYFNRKDQKFGTQTPNSFGFYMIENIQEAKNSVSNYYDRDKKDGATFVNAPEYGTYVRVYGKYEEKKADGKVVLQGDVNYTIHLGDFSGGDFDAYSVNRNYKYTYNVTINGVQQIIVEATAEDDSAQQYQHGAEGYIINTEGVDMVYTFDAHYEDALIKIDTSSFDKDGHGFILRVATPYMDNDAQNTILTWADFKNTDEATFKQTYDIDWIQFYPITKTETAPTARTAYPNAANGDQEKLMNVYELYHELYKLVDADDTTTSSLAEYVNSAGTIYFMAFVNEYFYDKHPLTGEATDWTKFANAKPRSMYMLQNPDKSTDGNSTYATVLCAFEQKSIQTMFKKEGTVNAYGIEWYDETANANLANFSGSNDYSNGYLNYFGGTRTEGGVSTTATGLMTATNWENCVNETAVRYGLDGQPNGNIYNSLTNRSGEYACMQRNRDLNGNGTIDDNEKRWYLGSSDQYIQMWIGETAIDPYARMSGIITATTEAEYEDYTHYYTSSNDAHRIYWASEAGSTGKYDDGWMATYHKARCVRTLTSYDAEPATIYAKSGNQITMNHLQEGAYRQSGAMVGEYGEHNELDEQRNRIPYSIEVAEEWVGSYIINADQLTYASPVVSYVSASDKSFDYNDVRYREGNRSYSIAKGATDDEIVITFNGQTKLWLRNDYLKNAGLANLTIVELEWESLVVTDPNGNDVTSAAAKDENFGFCCYHASNADWYHSLGQDSYGFEPVYETNSGDDGIGFNIEGGHTPTWSSYPITVTIKGLKVAGASYSEPQFEFTTSDDSAIQGATFYYTTDATYATTNPITLDENNCAPAANIPVPAYIWAKGNDGNHSAYTYVNASYAATRQATADDSDGETRGPVFNVALSASENICAEHYSQESDGSDLGQWRIPNERELQAMGLNGFLTANTLSRTKFSAYPNAGPARYGFWWDAGAQIQTLETTGADEPEDNTGYVRCVRDVAVTETTTVETEGTSAGSYSDRGNLTSAN